MSRVRDVAWVLGCYVAAGIVGGLVWWLVVEPPYFVRTAQGAVMDQMQLGRRVRADGWFMVVGASAGVLGGLLLTWFRDRAPVLVLLVGTLAALLAGCLALSLGTVLGHSDVTGIAESARVGTRIPDSLTLISPLVLITWPLGYLIGAVSVLWGLRARQADDAGTPSEPLTQPAHRG